MARLSDDDFQALRDELDRSAAAPLAGLRRASGQQRDADADAWLRAGDTLGEKAIAALDLGDDGRARSLVGRIVALPADDGSTPSGLMAVSVLLVGEILEPLHERPDAGLLDAPLRLLPGLDPPVAAELRRALAALLGRGLPAALERRVRDAVDVGERLDPPFADVADADLPDAVTGVLRLVLRLRSDDGAVAAAD